MKYFLYTVLVVLIVLSLAAGGAKAGYAEQEVAFFSAAGIDTKWLLPFGLFQIAGALVAIFHKYRPLGLLLISLGFLASSAMILLTQNVFFALISCLPVIAALILRSRLPLDQH